MHLSAARQKEGLGCHESRALATNIGSYRHRLVPVSTGDLRRNFSNSVALSPSGMRSTVPAWNPHPSRIRTHVEVFRLSLRSSPETTSRKCWREFLPEIGRAAPIDRGRIALNLLIPGPA